MDDWQLRLRLRRRLGGEVRISSSGLGVGLGWEGEWLGQFTWPRLRLRTLRGGNVPSSRNGSSFT